MSFLRPLLRGHAKRMTVLADELLGHNDYLAKVNENLTETNTKLCVKVQILETELRRLRGDSTSG